MPDGDPLELFHPIVRQWFAERVGAPTEVQALAWPRIAEGSHVLATAPTGSGKTLAAFLWAIDRLLSGQLAGGAVRVLYVSPLKALAADIRRNLLAPLAELRERFDAAGVVIPEVRALVRSGDTPAEERARMARRPPEILITTPESLNIMLTARRGRELLAGVTAVILDEVHAVVGNKRGVHLITAVERLARVAGEFQRIALSATVRPLDRVARWVAGAAFEMVGGEPALRPRRVVVVAASEVKSCELEVGFPAGPGAAAAEAPARVWEAVVAAVRARIGANRSTLVFANSRRIVEKLARLLNDAENGEVAYSHHGSLSREVRAVVEERLKRGELRAIVATSSLELGIDIGALDEVVLVQTPPTVASAVQRIGRSGHAVGAASRGRFLPLHPTDLLYAAVTAKAVAAGAIEEVAPVRGALDVLAQVIVSATATETWRVDDLFAVARAADPYRDLTRRQFNLVLEMLAGRYASSRIATLKPVIALDRVDGTVRGRPGAERLVYAAGGTIPDRGYYRLRAEDSGALIGELDEEFVWERSVGDSFTLGVQAWRIERITHNDVFVRPARAHAAMAPFWRADERDRSFTLLAQVGELLERAEARIADPEFARELAGEYHLHPSAAAALVRYLSAQEAAAGVLPHRHRVVAERVGALAPRAEGEQLILHTLWGGKVNRPFALALATAWRRRIGTPVEIIHDDACIAIAAPAIPPTEEVLALVAPAEVTELLRESLAASGYFGARFRLAAACALLLPREGFGRRTPLWLSRQRAKELLAAVQQFDDFPIVLEAWRTCLEDEFELDALSLVLEELATRRIEVREVQTEVASPFAAGVSWRRTNALMYEDDTPLEGKAHARADLLREVVASAHLRPRLAPSLVAAFERKLKRTAPGWAPRDESELLEHVKERVLLPREEWRELLVAIARDWAIDPGELVGRLAEKLAAVAVGGGEPAFVAAVESLPWLLRACGIDSAAVSLFSVLADGSPASAAQQALARLLAAAPQEDAEDAEAVEPAAELVAGVLHSYGPVSREALAEMLPMPNEQLELALAELADAQRIVVDTLLAGSDQVLLCLADNLERLLRASRAASRPAFEPLPLSVLPLFLASWHGLGTASGGGADLEAALDRLFGYAAPAELWETEILPARLDPYYASWLDALLAGSGLEWVGCGEKRLAFVLADDHELVGTPESETGGDSEAEALFPPCAGRFTFEELLARCGRPSAELAATLWRLTWAGAVANDSFAAVRQGLATRFQPPATATEAIGGAHARRSGFARWRRGRPFAGHWRRLAPPAPAADAIEHEERNRRRARLLLDRYGVLFRELLERELPPLAWPAVARTLRIMELSGEVVSGRFFAGIAGMQFASHAALRRIEHGLAADRVFWLSAADPISPCGLGLADLCGLPHRLAGNHVVYHGERLAVISERRGRRLQVAVSPEHPDLPRYLSFFKVALTRQERPARAIVIEEINGAPAASSPCREALAAMFHVVAEGASLRLGRRY